MNFTTKKLSLLIFMGLLVSCVSGTPQIPAQVDGVAAIVNGEIITFSEVRQLYQPFEAELRQKLQGAALAKALEKKQLSVLDDLILRKLILHEFKAKKYTLSDATIDELIQSVVDLNFRGDRAAFLKTLRDADIEPKEYRQEYREQIIAMAMRQQFVSRPAEGKSPEERQKIEEAWCAHLRAQSFVKKF